MVQRLIDYYERELAYLRTAGQVFAHQFPKVAQRLELSADECPDPHVERLLEGFAFLTARLHENIDDSSSQLARQLLEQLYPHALRPVPSASIACFDIDPGKAAQAAGYRIARGTPLFCQSSAGDTVHFRTSAMLELWPFSVAGCELRTERLAEFTSLPAACSVLQVDLECPAAFELAPSQLPTLRFHVSGGGATAAQLCDLLAAHTLQVLWRSAADAPLQELEGVRPRFTGLDPDEALLPERPDTEQAYRLLVEYFAFPLKFQFFGLDARMLALPALPGAAPGALRRCQLFFVFDRLPHCRLPLARDALMLGCTPIVNLFPRTAEPLRVTGRQAQYRLVPDQHRLRCTEIYSVEEVLSPGSGAAPERIAAYFDSRAAVRQGARYWHAQRVPGTRADLPGSEMQLSFVDPAFDPAQPAQRTLVARVLCTNRDLARQLPAGAVLSIEEAVPVAGIRALHKPTAQVQPALDGAARWRLVSQLTLNQLSIVEGTQALQRLREMLSLNNLAQELSAQQQIQGIVGLVCQRVTRHVAGDAWQGYRQGYRVVLQLDSELFRDCSRMLFGSVLHRFLALYAGINTFVELAVHDEMDRPLHTWRPLPQRGRLGL